MNKNKEALPPNWIICQSKSRTGKSYYFNKSTGETSWTVPTASWISSSSSDNLRNPSNPLKNAKTPAQDRLKRLQTNFKTKSIAPANIGAKSTNLGKVNQNQSNAKQSQSTNQTKKSSEVPKAKSAENKNVAMTTAQGENPKKPTPIPVPVASTNKTPLKKTSNEENKKTEVLKKPTAKPVQQGKNNPKLVQKIVHACRSAVSSLVGGKRKAENKIQTSPKKVQKNQTENAKKDVPKIANSTAPVIQKVQPTATISIPQKDTYTSPTNGKFSANSRLERLRTSLEAQKSNESGIKGNGNLIEDAIMNAAEKSNQSLNSVASTTMDYEEMDWETIDDDTSDNISLGSHGGLKVNEIHQKTDETCETFSEYYDVVKENLFRMSAEAHNAKSSKSHYSQNQYYLVVDTNVFADNLAFLNETLKISKIVLIVPYCVLQELDTLKHRSKDSISTKAIRAIKFLNSIFENSNSNVKGQSAIESRQRLIDIESPDDSILNCCLQLKEKTNNVILISNDVNLRNKAHCNQIQVTTTDDLFKTHFTRA